MTQPTKDHVPPANNTLGNYAQALQLVAYQPTISKETKDYIRKELTPRLKKGKHGQYSTQEAYDLLFNTAWSSSVDKATFLELLNRGCFAFEI